jgi:hypothetical protein
MQNLRWPTGLAFVQSWWAHVDRALALDGLMFGSIGLLGLLRLAEPLWGDQALFVVGGQAIHAGGVLYRDFWDLKPPGIYGLYALAGSLFGFTSVGVHTLDLIWMLTLAIVLRVTLVPYFKRRWIAQIIPWLMVGSYFALIDSRQQMQVESLVGLPLYLVVWCTLKAAQQPAQRWRWLIGSGLAGGGVLLFKLIYLPLLLALWSVYLAHGLVAQRRSFVPALWQTSWPLAVGTLLPIVPVILYWQSQGLLGDVFYTLVQYPPRLIQTHAPRPMIALIRAVGWFGVTFLPLLGLTGLGIYRSLRRWQLLTLQLLVWLGLGLVMILLQSQSWWSYHFMLLLLPVAVLAGYGIDWTIDAVRSPQMRAFRHRRYLKILLLGCLAWLGMAQIYTVITIAQAMGQSALPISPAAQLQYQIHVEPLYKALNQEAEFLRQADRQPGPIYVIGNPVLYLLAERSQAVPLQGWVSEILLPEQWRQLESQLIAAKPHYIHVTHFDAGYMDKQFQAFLQARYGLAQSSEIGIWYELKG